MTLDAIVAGLVIGFAAFGVFMVGLAALVFFLSEKRKYRDASIF